MADENRRFRWIGFLLKRHPLVPNKLKDRQLFTLSAGKGERHGAGDARFDWALGHRSLLVVEEMIVEAS
jgi:hypothetical protein